MSDADITLATRIDDVSLLEVFYKAQKPVAAESTIAMSIDNPECVFESDVEHGRSVLRAVVNVRFEIDENAGRPGPDPAIVFGTDLGVVASVASMGEAVNPTESERGGRIARSLRLEAIKAAHGFASAKLAELSSISPAPKLLLPAIDADALLADLERQQAERRQ